MQIDGSDLEAENPNNEARVLGGEANSKTIEEVATLVSHLSYHLRHSGVVLPCFDRVGSDCGVRSDGRGWSDGFGPEEPSSVSTPELTADPLTVTPQMTRDSRMSNLNKDALSCRKCRLCEGRRNVVFGVGRYDSPPIVFVGEGPGMEEDAQGEPFVGKSGQLLTRAIENGMGLPRSQVYICNVVKCRPPENRAPLPDEAQACFPYLEEQLIIAQPKVIVALGGVALKALLGDVKGGITAHRGAWMEWKGTPLLATFHPAYLLRNPNAKSLFWDDLKLVMSHLGLERPVKQV